MKFSNGLVISAIVLGTLTTGCVQKTTTATANETPVAYDNSQPQTVYETAAPIVYGNTAITPSGSIYTGEATDSTVISTSDAYGQTVSSAGDTAYGQPAVSANGAFNNPYSNDTSYADPYAGTTVDNSTYSSNTTSSAQGGGIHLQIASLKDYYAAEEFKNGLSLEPGLTAYVKRGATNKVIVSGISSLSEVNRLKESRFPGAFVVSGSATSSSTYNSNSGYTTNNSYGSSSSTASLTGIGVQIGAFSTHSKAQSAADSASSKYGAFVKTVSSGGRTLYKAILTGFSSESEARTFIANRGAGFIVHGL